MYRSRISALFFLIVIQFNLSFGSTENTTQYKNILVLFSLSPTTPAYRVILDGIRTQLTREFGDSYNLHVEYLESERYPKGNYSQERFDLFNKKYKNVDLDMLICVGIDIVSTIKTCADRYLLNLPNVSLDYDFSSYGIHTEITLNEQTAEIPLKIEAEKTISAALRLFPETKSVYFFCGISGGDRLFYTVSKEAVKNLKSLQKITFITDTTMDDALKVASQLPDKSLVIVSSFNTDANQVPYFNPESVRLISSSANAPTFTYTDMGFGDGSVGGYIISFNKVGLLTGEIAVKLLNGTDPNSIQVSKKDYYAYAYDWRQLERWNIADSGLVPEQSTILFKDANIFRKYQWIIIGGILFLVLQTGLILNLVRMNRKHRVMALRVIDSENKYRELLREDRVLRISQLTAALSHELNQPLTAILSTAQAGIRFIESKNADPDLLKELFKNIAEDDKRTASVLGSIRGMLKLEKREKEKINLNDLIDELVNVYNGEAIQQAIRLDVKLSGEPVYIFADKIQIQQVLMNLISNAFQAMTNIPPENRIIALTESVTGDVVTITLRDQGEGIDESVKDKLFYPFITSKKEGQGIGLTICRTIIDEHQGKIWAGNHPDGGAEFSFSLKIIEDAS